MTLKDIDEQEVIISVPDDEEMAGDSLMSQTEAPVYNRVEHSFITFSNETYLINTEYSDNPPETLVYSNTITGAEAFDTWTVPEYGIYYISVDPEHAEKTIRIQVNDVRVTTTTLSTFLDDVRVLYGGFKVRFEVANSNGGSTHQTDIEVYQVDNTNNVKFGTSNNNDIEHRPWVVRKPTFNVTT